MKNRVHVLTQKRGLVLSAQLRALIKQSVQAALRYEGIETPCEVNILYTDNAGIRVFNARYRDVDAPTDVLSFPLLAHEPGEKLTFSSGDADPETGAVWLGDIILSVERMYAQAQEYGHSTQREAAFLTVHAVLHLLGYDHELGPEQEKRMFEKTECILSGMGLSR